MELAPNVVEAIHQTLRVLMAVTGTLVAIDSVGILIGPVEHPAHKPKWSAISWLILASVVASVSIYLLAATTGFVGNDSPSNQRIAVWVLYSGLTVSFTCRAISRAHRPFFTLAAVIGMSIAGVLFALWDTGG